MCVFLHVHLVCTRIHILLEKWGHFCWSLDLFWVRLDLGLVYIICYGRTLEINSINLKKIAIRCQQILPAAYTSLNYNSQTSGRNSNKVSLSDDPHATFWVWKHQIRFSHIRIQRQLFQSHKEHRRFLNAYLRDLDLASRKMKHSP